MKQFVIGLFLAAVLATSCGRQKNQQQALQQSVIQPTQQQHVFEVADVIQGNTYTYLQVKENGAHRWVAIAKSDVQSGEVYYYDEALQMTQFHSKEIDRTFEVIYFINRISKTPMSGSAALKMPAGHTGKVKPRSAAVKLDKTDGERTLAEVFENREAFSREPFEIRGIVVKVNPQIMGKNWVHIQDGTQSEGIFDLTITTQQQVNVGDEVRFRGKLSLKKDFGAGYYYDVIMEDASLVPEAN